MYNATINADAAARLINAVSYETEIADTKQKAAEEYYNKTTSFYKALTG